MRLISFEVEGFKNLREKVRLSDLGDITVLHGDNSVGKSNLLLAIEVFFWLLSGIDGAVGVPAGVRELGQVKPPKVGRWKEIFNFANPAAISASARVALSDEERKQLPPRPGFDATSLDVEIVIFRIGDSTRWHVSSLRSANGDDLLKGAPTGDAIEHVSNVARWIGARGLPVSGRATVVDSLYDAHVSNEKGSAAQWERFEVAMTRFEDILGKGRFIAVLPRGQAHASLLYETPSMRIPFEALGTGAQHIVTLIGDLFTRGRDLVMLEEPEVFLRWSRQEQLRDVLTELVGQEGAPSQLIIATHSGAFEVGEAFYLMERGEKGPTVSRKAITELSSIVGPYVPRERMDPTKRPTYVTSEGIVRLPDRIRKAIHVEHGGGVAFVDKEDGRVELMSDETFFKLAGIPEDDVAQ